MRAEKRLRYETQKASDEASDRGQTGGGEVSVSGGGRLHGVIPTAALGAGKGLTGSKQ